ncbi:hypothetical protein QYM36_003059 [Artemia franciscana]|uniref:ZP domain-containing protein n=1 Tax=Artemia franciscana TaxID=6661 RepID=A0AA88LA25_ARTSF|nr:hypothetical protein QYM36_003059 [Artemia franciscana]
MDIQIGKGPLAPSANSLVRIGKTMTMVISATGDPGFDIHVRDCITHDGNRNNPVILTDNNGCVLKKKLMGPWQKTRQTGNAEINLLAFAFFQAFKFPDQVEVFLECNIGLCKSECGFCPEDQALFGRKKRSLQYNKATLVSDPVRLARRLRVFAPDDVAFADGRSTITLTTGELKR